MLYLVAPGPNLRYSSETPMLMYVVAPSLMPEQLLKTLATHRLAAALILTLVFAIIAFQLHGVSRSGAIAGAGVSFVLYVAAGPTAFLALMLVFLLTLIATRVGYSRKQRLGTAEKRGGRTASQVLANLGVAAISALLYEVRGNGFFLAACVASLAEPAADTVSSEIGQAASAKAWLITTWQSVPPGTNGGISFVGTVAGFLAAAIVCWLCAAWHLIPWNAAGIAATAGALGMLLDSFLGAQFELQQALDNDQVNFLATLGAALLAGIAVATLT